MVNHLSVGVNTFNKNAFSPNVDQGWRDQGICIPNAVDCNQNFGIISFSEFCDLGRIVLQRDGAAAVLDQGRPHDQHGVAHDQDRLHLRPAASQRLRSAGSSAAGPASASWKRPCLVRRRWPTAAATRSRRSCSASPTPAGPRRSAISSRSIPTTASTRRTTGGSTTSWCSTTACATSSRSRREPAAISTPTSRRPSRIRPSTTIPARWCLPVTDRDERARAASSPATTARVAPRVSFAYSANDKTIVRGGVGRSFGRVTVVQGSSHFAGFIGQYVFSSADAGVTPAFNLDQGLPAYPLPPLIDPTFSNNNDVDWFNGQAASRPATYDNWTISVQRELRNGTVGGARLQRRVRIEPPVWLAQSQPGADVGGERPDRQVRPDRRARPAELANHVCCRDGRRHSSRRIRTSPTPPSSVPERSPRRCGRIRSTSR